MKTIADCRLQIADCELQYGIAKLRGPHASKLMVNLQFAICNLQFAIPLKHALLFLLTFSLCGCGSNADDSSSLEPNYTVADFLLSERGGQPIQRSDLQGKTWIAGFIFTRCAGPCAQISKAMASLQKDLKGEKDVLLVSITVDPEYDSAEILRDYAKKYGADEKRWLFLTGEREPIYKLIRGSFHLGVEPSPDATPKAGYEVDHSVKLALVDGNFQVRGYFDGTNPEEVEKLKRKIKAIVPQSPLPAVNALLNSLSALLLVVGLLAIKTRRIGLHKACMLSALVVSTAFLASYLYYHFAIKRGVSTEFTGTGLVRPFYYSVLISHIVLAVIVVPMAIITAVFGLRNRLDRHRKLARWTFPIWLYVSVTGVVVYWMLYHLYAAR